MNIIVMFGIIRYSYTIANAHIDNRDFSRFIPNEYEQIDTQSALNNINKEEGKLISSSDALLWD